MSFLTVTQALLAALVSTTTIGIATAYVYHPVPDTEIHELGGIGLLNSWSFFTRRYDFVAETFRRTRQKLFRFRVLQHRVIASSGIDARKIFFSEKSLNLDEGYKILQGVGPDMADIQVDTGGMDKEGNFIRQLLTLTTKDLSHADAVFPSLLSDVNNLMEAWGPAGSIDPFTEVYKLVFQVTVRIASCHELADDPAAVERLSQLYWTLQTSATPIAVLLPWFPSPSRKARQRATAELFAMLHSYVELRRNAAVPSSDAIDVLLAEGTPTDAIIGFILGTIFAGVINSGINVCWSLLHLGMDPHWKALATAEVRALVARHTNASATSDPLHKRLAAIPVGAWEAEMPVADAVIRETLRLAMGGVALRRNLVHDVPIGRQTLARGDFLAYSLADVHFDADIYPEPFKFDPGRYDAGREEDKGAPFAYLGWGAGRHPCAGMKVAKLEMKVVLGLFLIGCEYEVVDPEGRPLVVLPQIDRNDLHLARPLQPCHIKFRRVEA
ncbi:cytochrome P450 [Mycena epipterygia]|nr:cytochrome P450 [Mycena epipterygia]